MADMSDQQPSTESQHLQLLFDLQKQVATLTTTLLNLQTQQQQQQPTTPPAPVAPKSSLKLSPPKPFDGSLDKADEFLSHLALYFIGTSITKDSEKVNFALSYMQGGTAGKWVTLMTQEVLHSKETPAWVNDWGLFMQCFAAQFRDPDAAGTARHQLSLLKQRANTADEYIASFKLLMLDTGYNDAALVEKFRGGLNSSLVDQLYKLPQMPTDLQEWFHWAAKLDRQYREREAQKKLERASYVNPLVPKQSQKPSSSFIPTLPTTSSGAAPRSTYPVPMEVDSAQKRQQFKPKVCFKCRKPGHIAAYCTSTVNISALSYDELAAHFTQKKEETSEPKKDFA